MEKAAELEVLGAIVSAITENKVASGCVHLSGISRCRCGIVAQVDFYNFSGEAENFFFFFFLNADCFSIDYLYHVYPKVIR